MVSLLWVGSIVGTIVIADRKNLNAVWYFILSLFLGPVALIIAFLSEARVKNPERSPAGKFTAQEARQQLEGIKTALNMLNTRVERIEAALNQESEEEPVVYSNHASVYDSGPEPKKVQQPSGTPQETMEFIFGKYWMNRIGVVLFVIGIGLFINYTFQYFSAWAKIAMGYAIAVLFLLWGQKMEKTPRYQKLAWGVLGGAWGIFYLVTYAMFYVPATKVISNAYLELALLWLVTICAVQYNLKYRSWVATAMSYFLGFITIGLASLDATSVLFWAMLLGSLVYLACRFNWDELLSAGMVGAYWIYVAALQDKLVLSYRGLNDFWNFSVHMNLLAIAWFFFLGAFLFQQKKEANVSKGNIQRMILNTGAFAICGCFLINDSYLHSRDVQFNFILIVAAGHCLAAFLSRVLKSFRYIVFHGVMTIVLFSVAILLKYHQLTVTYWWILQMVMTFVLGIYYREAAYRILGWLMSLAVILRFFWVDLQSSQTYMWGAMTISHSSVVAVIISLVLFILGAVLNSPKIQGRLTADERTFLLASLPFLGTLVAAGWLWKNSATRWLTLHLSVLGLGQLAFGFMCQYRAMRWCALGLFTLCCLRILIFDLAAVDTIYKIIVVIFLGAAMLGVSLFYSRTKSN